MTSFRKLWAGSLPLSTAFWVYLIGGGLIVLAALGVLGGVAVIVHPSARVPVYVAVFIITWAYLAVACVGTWRSADTAKAGSLRIVAKVVVALLAVWFLFILTNKNGIVAMLRGTWQPGSYLQKNAR